MVSLYLNIMHDMASIYLNIINDMVSFYLNIMHFIVTLYLKSCTTWFPPLPEYRLKWGIPSRLCHRPVKTQIRYINEWQLCRSWAVKNCRLKTSLMLQYWEGSLLKHSLLKQGLFFGYYANGLHSKYIYCTYDAVSIFKIKMYIVKTADFSRMCHFYYVFFNLETASNWYIHPW